jgi:hypothetical protein
MKRGTPEYEARKAAWAAARVAEAPPLTEQQAVIIRTNLAPFIRRQGRAA